MDDLLSRLLTLAGSSPAGVEGRELTSYERSVQKEALASIVDIPSALLGAEGLPNRIEDFREAVLNMRHRPDWSVQNFHAYDLDPIRDLEEVAYNGPGPSRQADVDRIGDAVGEDLSWLTTIGGYPSELVREMTYTRSLPNGWSRIFVKVGCYPALREAAQHYADWMNTPRHIATDAMAPDELTVLTR